MQGRPIPYHGGPDETIMADGVPSDSVDGLSYFGARYYDPVIMRFLTRDPGWASTDPTNENSYSYANDDPRLFGRLNT